MIRKRTFHRKGFLVGVVLVFILGSGAVHAPGAEPATGTVQARIGQGVWEVIEHGPAPLYLTHVRGVDPAVVWGDLARLGLDHQVFPRVGVTEVIADGDTLDLLRGLPWVSSIHAGSTNELLLDRAAPLVNVTTVWEDLGYRGDGVGVFVMDSGVDALHPDLVDRVVESVMCAEQHSAVAVLTQCTVLEDVPFNDVLGHGTHVIGILSGTGEALGPIDPTHGRYVGIAPGVDVVSWGLTHPGFPTRLILHGYEYALEHQDRLGIRVVSNSWGDWEMPDPEAPISVATLEMYRAGIAVVFGAGNSYGSQWPFLNTYGQNPWALSIGGTQPNGDLMSWTSRGTDPRESGVWWDHPSLVAPGEAVMAAKSRAGSMQTAHIQWFTHPGSPMDEHVAFATHYQLSSGTSMSAPVVAGVLALMFEANPNLSPAQAYDILVETSRPLQEGNPYWEAGAGLVDAGAAVERALIVEGRLEGFLAGDAPYTDWEDPLDEPLRRFLVENRPHGVSAKALIEHLTAEGWLEDSGGPLEGQERSVPSAPIIYLVALMVGTVGLARLKRGGVCWMWCKCGT